MLRLEPQGVRIRGDRRAESRSNVCYLLHVDVNYFRRRGNALRQHCNQLGMVLLVVVDSEMVLKGLPN